jgi:CBS domain-containing protein
MKVKEIMTANPSCCTPHDSALDAAWVMRHFEYGCLPVVSGQTTRRLVGMVTDRDLCMAVLPRGVAPSSVCVGDTMARNPITCTPEDSVEFCAALMRQSRIRRIPVIDEFGSCVGIISHSDLAMYCDSELVKMTESAFPKPRVMAIA